MWQVTHRAPAEPGLWKWCARRVEVARRAAANAGSRVACGAWHCRHTALPASLSLPVCASWQFVQPTPFWYIWLCRNEPSTIHLVELLAVGVVEAAAVSRLGRKWSSRGWPGRRGREFAAPRVAGRAQLRPAAPLGLRQGGARGRSARPATSGGRLPCRRSCAHCTCRSPGPWHDWHDTLGSLQRDAKVSARGVVALLEAGGVADDAHRVRGLVATGPVQHVARRRLLVGQQVEPALAVRCPTRSAAAAAARPASRSGTAAAARRRRCSSTSKSASLPSGPSVRTKNLSPRLKKRVVTPWCLNVRAVEVAAHRLLGGRGHRLRVVRLLPLAGLVLMAAQALLVVDI